MAVREEMTPPPQFYIDKLTTQAEALSLPKPNAAECRRWYGVLISLSNAGYKHRPQSSDHLPQKRN